MNTKLLLFSFISTVTLSVIFLSPSAAFAKSGPTGLNEIRTEAGPQSGEVTLNWRRYHADVTDYNVRYGTEPGKYVYGADKIGNIVSYTVKALKPGVRYYFLITPYRNGQISTPTSPEVSEVAATGAHIVEGTAGPYGRNLLTATKTAKKGEVLLNWKRFHPDTDSYTLVYGLKPGVYIYGVVNAKDASPADNDFNFTVGQLASGTRYYFALIPQSQGNARYVTAEVSQVAP